MATEYNAPKGADSDLVSRLREAGRGWLRLGRDKDGGLAIEAADRIEALEAENAKLRTDVRLMKIGEQALREELSALRSDLALARAALPHP